MADEAELDKFLEGCRKLLAERLMVLDDAVDAGNRVTDPPVPDVAFGKSEKIKLGNKAYWPSGSSCGICVGAETFYVFKDVRLHEVLLEACEYASKRILHMLEQIQVAVAWCKEEAEKRNQQARRAKWGRQDRRDHAVWAYEKQPEAVKEIKALLVARELKGAK